MNLFDEFAQSARNNETLVRVFRRSRSVVIRRFPDMARAYWAVRDSLIGRGDLKRTPFGFLLAGNATMQAGAHEPELTRTLREELDKADVFVDIGANIGYYTCLARLLEKHVVAFEPLQSNLQLLYRNLSANGWDDVEVFPLGTSNHVGLLPLYGTATGASLVTGWSGALPEHQRLVPLTTLDIALGSRFVDRRCLVKIDIEGSEYEALLGAGEMLRTYTKSVWVLETCVTEHHPNAFNPNFRAVFELFWNAGYRTATADSRRISIGEHEVDRWVTNRRNDCGAHNFIFSREPR